MVVLMVCASLYAVLQLAVLGSLTRSTRVGTAILAVATGCLACGAVAIAAELIYTRLVALASGRALDDVVRTASFTVDPFIEEIVKILPLLLVAAIGVRRRVQWGLTDFLIIGAAIGSGFALAEALLRFSWHAGSALSDHHGGVVLAISLDAPTIRGPLELLGTWLPAPAGSWDLFGNGTADLNLHLLWTGVAGIGIGILVRMRGWRRILGLVPLLYSAIDHAVSNFASVTSPTGAVGVLVAAMGAVRLRLPLVLFLVLVAATVVDLRLTRPVRRNHPALLTAAERSGRPALFALGRYALVYPPWTALVAVRFVLVRRAVWYAIAGRPDREPAELVDTVAGIAARIDRSADPRRWRLAVEELTAGRKPLSHRIRDPWVISWLVLSVLPVIYFVVAGAPLTGGLQRSIGDLSLTQPVAGVLLALGLAYGISRLVVLLRAVPARNRSPWAEGLLRITLRVLVGAATCGMSVAVLILLLTGVGQYSTTISNYHLIEALGDALLLASLLLLLAALLTIFPPGGAAVVAAAGEATTAEAAAAGAAGAAVTKTAQAVILGSAGYLLMNASDHWGDGDEDDDPDLDEADRWDQEIERKYGDRRRGGRGGGKGGGRQRQRGDGEGGRPGNYAAQNRQVDDAIREAERRLDRDVNADDRERIHRELHRPGTGNLDYWGLVDLIVDELG